MKIDVHNHVLPEVSLDLLRTDRTYNTTITADSFAGGNHGAFYLDPAFYDPRAKAAELDSKRLDAAILSTAPPLFFYDVDAEAGEKMARTTNQGLRDFAAAEPGRFRWMATVPMAAPDRVVAVLEDAARDGAIGVEVGTNVVTRRLDDPAYEPFWAAAEKLNLPVMLHPAFNEANRGLDDFYFQNVIGNQLETTIAIERLIAAGVLGKHPDVRVVLVHAGGYFPFQAGRLRHAKTVRRELENAPVDPKCGARDNPCPLQKWMRANMAPALAGKDGPALAKALERTATFSPNPAWEWAAISKTAAEAAKKGDIDTARQSCQGCHSKFKAPYKEKFRVRPAK